jgi:hypothetical protein
MPPKRKGGKGAGSSPPAAAGDRLSTLPDDILHHVLSFLPAEDGVRTCVLARRWRHLWKSATSLHIVRHNLDDQESVKAAREFVDHLLLLRCGSPLDTCELSLAEFNDDDDISRLNLWIRHILTCRVRVLRLDILSHGSCVEFDGLTLISDHLKRLQLSNIEFDDKLLDFSCCPALEVLEIDDCDLSYADKISSQSLKCLSISRDCNFAENSRGRIYAPNLHSLRLEIGNQRTPVLEGMPSLVEASVTLCDSNCDCCDTSDFGNCGDDECFACYEVDEGTNNCVLLQGLSEARNLLLISDAEIVCLDFSFIC